MGKGIVATARDAVGAYAATGYVVAGKGILTMASVALLVWAPVQAETVTYDLGGGLESRFQHMADMQARNEAVRITGTCFSACTLYLGLSQVCVTPQARLGFHGPSTALPGLPLPAAEFERQSRRMATYYPPALQNWFLTQARYVTGDVYLLTGAQVIALGVKAC